MKLLTMPVVKDKITLRVWGERRGAGRRNVEQKMLNIVEKEIARLLTQKN